MNTRLSNILTAILVAALVLGAVCIGGVKRYKDERQELLLTCMEMHVKSGINQAKSIKTCEEATADFDARLKHQLMGKVASSFGVEPITESVQALHAQLIAHDSTVTESPDFLTQFGQQVGQLLEDNIDTKLSFSKVFWTVVLLSTLFGKKRHKSSTLRKLLAGFGLFRIWRKK